MTPGPQRQYILELWNSWLKAVDLTEAPPEQRKEMRRAFYAGAMALLSTILANVTDGPNAEEADEILMKSIQRELDDFKNGVITGRN